MTEEHFNICSAALHAKKGIIITCSPHATLLPRCAASMTRFWIMALEGRKLVRLLPPSENARADPADIAAFQPTLFTADLMDPDFAAHPRMNGMLVYEALLEPGDLLFIPEGWAHQALNVEWNAMISSNYVDQHNVDLHLEWHDFDEAWFPLCTRQPCLACGCALPARALTSICAAAAARLGIRVGLSASQLPLCFDACRFAAAARTFVA